MPTSICSRKLRTVGNYIHEWRIKSKLAHANEESETFYCLQDNIIDYLVIFRIYVALLDRIRAPNVLLVLREAGRELLNEDPLAN